MNFSRHFSYTFLVTSCNFCHTRRSSHWEPPRSTRIVATSSYRLVSLFPDLAQPCYPRSAPGTPHARTIRRRGSRTATLETMMRTAVLLVLWWARIPSFSSFPASSRSREHHACKDEFWLLGRMTRAGWGFVSLTNPVPFSVTSTSTRVMTPIPENDPN